MGYTDTLRCINVRGLTRIAVRLLVSSWLRPTRRQEPGEDFLESTNKYQYIYLYAYFDVLIQINRTGRHRANNGPNTYGRLIAQ